MCTYLLCTSRARRIGRAEGIHSLPRGQRVGAGSGFGSVLRVRVCDTNVNTLL